MKVALFCREMQGILACCNPIPLLVKQELHALHRIVLAARERPAGDECSPFFDALLDVILFWCLLQIALSKDPPNLRNDLRRSSLAWLKTPHDHSFTKSDEEIRPLAPRLDDSREDGI